MDHFEECAIRDANLLGMRALREQKFTPALYISLPNICCVKNHPWIIITYSQNLKDVKSFNFSTIFGLPKGLVRN